MKINTNIIILGIAWFTGIISSLLFLTNDIIHSPITKSLILFTVAFAIFVFWLDNKDEYIELTRFVLSIFISLISIFYLFTRFTSNILLVSITFGLITIILINVYNNRVNNTYFMDKSIIRKLFIVMFLITIIVFIYDIFLIESTLNFNINNEIIYNNSSNSYVVGEAVMTSSSILPHHNYPERKQLTGCISGVGTDESFNNYFDLYYSYSTYNLITSDSSEDIMIPSQVIDIVENNNYTYSDIYVVESENCIKSNETVKITVLK